jgi:hypothetical protein
LRTRFETALVQVKAYVRDPQKKARPPTCFVSYAWGEVAHERWVEKRLARDLQNAGIDVILDRWHNAAVGAPVHRFISLIEKSRTIVVIGTPLYRKKYENKLSKTGSVVAAEVDLIAQRLLGTEKQKNTVLPVLLDGDEQKSLPPLLRGRNYADFRREAVYFAKLFDLILTLYSIPFESPAVADLRDALHPGRGGRSSASLP